jgi:hypothetical protein
MPILTLPGPDVTAHNGTDVALIVDVSVGDNWDQAH